MKEILFILISIISFSSIAECKYNLKSEFEYPQSLRYRVDAIINYSDPEGNVCIKRLPDKEYFDIFIFHPHKTKVLGIARFPFVAGQQEYSIDYNDLASNLICNNNCSPDVIKKMNQNKDFEGLVKDVKTLLDELESPYDLVTDEFKENSKEFIKYLGN